MTKPESALDFAEALKAWKSFADTSAEFGADASAIGESMDHLFDHDETIRASLTMAMQQADTHSRINDGYTGSRIDENSSCNHIWEAKQPYGTVPGMYPVQAVCKKCRQEGGCNPLHMSKTAIEIDSLKIDNAVLMYHPDDPRSRGKTDYDRGWNECLHHLRERGII